MNPVVSLIVAVMNSLWQAALLAAFVWLVLRFAPKVNAATRFAIWWAVLGVVLMLPAAPGLIRHTQDFFEPDTLQASKPLFAPPATPRPVFEGAPLVTVEPGPGIGWPHWIAAVWTMALLYRLSHLMRGVVYLRGVKRRACVSSEFLPRTHRNARLLISSEIDSPIAVGFVCPAIILPKSLGGELSREEMGHVLLHETAHLARRDDWTNLLARILGAFLALHPVALWVLRRIELECEVACDDWVVSRTQSASRYARSLARLYDLRFAGRQTVREELLAPGVLGGSVFIQRLEMLFRAGRDFAPRVSPAPFAAAVLALVAVGSVVSLSPGWIAFAQAPRPAFEVASIKHSPELTAGESGGVTFAARPGGRMEVRNNPMSNVINNAYGIAHYQLIDAPDWVNSERYDIEAKAAGPASRKEMMLMLQTLLADRFAMKAHMETRQSPAYILTVAKGGAKLRLLEQEDCVPHDSTKTKEETPPNECGNNHLSRTDGWTASHISMPGVIGVLSMVLRGPVIDQTGLKGAFDVRLRWSDDLAVQDNPDAPPSLTSALHETLGLDVKRGRGPVEFLVIDHIERPTGN
jgi:uncharacterized protein (TIGR03435 family)